MQPHRAPQGDDIYLVQLKENLIVTHPAIAYNAADETLTVVINLNKWLLAMRQRLSMVVKKGESSAGGTPLQCCLA